MVKAADVVYKYYEVEFALKRENNDVLAWFGLFLAGINKFRLELGGRCRRSRRMRGARRLKIRADYTNHANFYKIA